MTRAGCATIPPAWRGPSPGTFSNFSVDFLNWGWKMRQLEPRSLWRISYRIWLGILLLTLFPLLVVGQDLSCSMENYRTAEGLQASLQEGRLLVTWTGEGESELRVSFGLDSSRPVIRELAIRKGVGEWSVLGHNLLPEFNVTTGLRRISEQQLNPVRDLQRPLSDDLVAREKWNVFWDAPLVVPGIEGINPGLPRRPEEIQRATAVFDTSRCEVATNGARLEITFPGVSMGIFSGSLRFTVYRGTNLFRQEVVAKTEEPSVAYKYSGGLAGFHIGPSSRVIWRDTSRAWQKYEFGGSPNSSPVALKARNRLAIAETGDGSIAVFPPPHKFFFAREVELNLGFVWYRKDNEKSYSIGIRHGDHEEAFPPYGFSKELWDQRTQQARLFAEANFALYNAPPGTWQRMPVYFYLSPDSGPETQQRVLAYTHNDRYRELPGYKVAISHFHTHFAEQLADLGTLDYQPPWIPAFRALGINIAMMSDFHADGHPKDLGPIRLTEQNNYFEACRRHSDRDFLIIPGEEPNAHFGGHYTMVFPRPVYWT